MLLELVKAGVWVAAFCYFLGALLQVRLNYKLKTTQGLSPYKTLLFFTSINLCNVFNFLIDIPLVYRVSSVSQLINAVLLVFQTYYYAKDQSFKQWFIFMAGLITLGSTALWIIGSFFAYHVGMSAAWTLATLSFLQAAAQIRKMYRDKTAYGYSIWWLYLRLIAVCIALAGAYAYGLPLSVYFDNSFMLLLVLSELLFFFIYGNRKKETTSL